MFRYTICFIRRGNRILLLNRNAPAWMGAWNGVGGKLEPGEAPLPPFSGRCRRRPGWCSHWRHFRTKAA
ncbi:hypothetical protein N6H14_07935 [Paenibacillus sp. CC-CFT747]|nr:hypothetical protein N6H14_07935 [Paenibacillus sp. CC-CFT747]